MSETRVEFKERALPVPSLHKSETLLPPMRLGTNQKSHVPPAVPAAD